MRGKILFLSLIFSSVISNTAFGQEKDPPKLKPGRKVDRTTAAGSTDSYRIKLKEGEFLRVEVEQRGIDLNLVLTAPDGSRVIEINDRKSTDGNESLMAIARLKGTYLLELQPAGENSKPGDYSILVEPLRKATEEDRDRITAKDMVREAGQLRALKDPQSLTQALEKYRSALEIWRKLGDRGEEARTLANTGQTLESMEKYGEAIEAYRQALPLLQQSGNPRDVAITSTNLGGVYFLAGEPKEAIDQFNRAGTAWKEVGDRGQEAEVFVRTGRAYEALNDRAKAIEAYSAALALYQQAADRPGEASTLLDLGALNRSLGKNREALEYLQKSLAIRDSLGQKAEIAEACNEVGRTHRLLGDFQKAEENFNRALELSRELNDRRLEATVLNNVSIIYFLSGQKDRAVKLLEEVLPIRRELNDRPGEASTLSNVGVYYGYLGENRKALEHYNLALPIWVDLKRPAEEAIAIHNIGETYDRLGEKQKALDQYTRAIEVARRLDAKQLEGQFLTNLATLYSSLGDKEKALDLYLQALEIHRATGDQVTEADTLHLLGFLHYEIDDKQKALEYLGQALSKWREITDRRGEAITLTATGMVYRSLGEYDKSLEYSRQALPLQRQAGNRAGEAETLINLGMIYGATGKKQEAIAELEQAVELSRAINDPSLEAKARYEIARAVLETSDFDESRRQIEQTLEIVETLRTKVLSQELRATYFSTVQKYYDFYIDLLMRLNERNPGMGFEGEALQASERARARSLLDILHEANADIREGVDPKLLERERALQEQLNGKAEAVTRLYAIPHKPEEIEALKKEIEALMVEYEATRAQIRQASPRYAALTQPSPLSLEEIQRDVLDPETVLLEYSLGETRSFLWLVSAGGIKSFDLPARVAIEEKARLAYEFLSAPNVLPSRPDAGRRRIRHEKQPGPEDGSKEQAIRAVYELSEMLLGPVAGELGTKRLLIVAEGALQYIPFAALIKPISGKQVGKTRRPAVAKPLIADHEIISLPSASTIAALRRETSGRRPAPNMIAVIADPVFEKTDTRITRPSGENEKSAPQSSPAPPLTVAEERLIKHIKGKPGDQSGILRIARLPYTRLEAEQVTSLVPESTRFEALDFDANRAVATSEKLGSYRYVHFATHGYLDSENPELSALVLSLVDKRGADQRGFLYAHEVYNLNLPAEVVVLSACDTGLGKEIKGEGLVGLTRGFMYAGAHRVVVSLWAVNDKATAELMTGFYRKMITDGLRPAAALRAAQIEMMKNNDWRAPYFWSAFVLQGEWR